jgi:GNAT superfamily N-acetyltransferase
MKLADLPDKLNRLSKRPPFLILQTILDRIPGCPLRLGKFYTLELAAARAKLMRGFGSVREGGPQDVAGMCLLENKEALFRKRFTAGERCVVAVDKGQIVGYEWFCLKSLYIEECSSYRLDIPHDTIYAYDALVNPAYRLRGIWVSFKKYLLDEGRRIGRDKLLTLVDHENTPSLKAHLRFGFVIVEQVKMLRLLNRSFFFEKPIDQGAVRLPAVQRG